MRFELVISRLLLFLGVGFLVANLQILLQYLRYRRLRSTALLVWRSQRPPFYGLLMSLGVVLGLLIFYKLGWQRRPVTQVFGEGMMFLYYVYLLPLSLRIGRGFYAEGVWSDKGFIPYSKIGGLTWRSDGGVALVIGYRARSIARRLVVPERHYAEARRVLRDKIATHDIHFTGKSLDLGEHDERDDV